MLMQHAEHCSLESLFFVVFIEHKGKVYGKLRARAKAEAYSHREYIIRFWLWCLASAFVGISFN